jgi:hypothetical protein
VKKKELLLLLVLIALLLLAAPAVLADSLASPAAASLLADTATISLRAVAPQPAVATATITLKDTAPAAPTFWSNFYLSAVAAPNAGPAVGAAISYALGTFARVEAGAKAKAGATVGFLGMSTNLQNVVNVANDIFGMDIQLPKGTRAGWAISTQRSSFGYIAYDVLKF